MNKKLYILFFTAFILFLAMAFQYLQELKTDFVNAYTTKPANGHSWAEMECTSDLCVVPGTGIGLGTDSPTLKLSVVGSVGATGSISSGGNISASGSLSSTGNISTYGSITATGDVCGGGACLSQIASYVGSQPLVMNVHNQAACTTAGGTVTPSDVSFPMCKFSASSCPSGWTHYKSYQNYGPTTCYVPAPTSGCYGASGAYPCTTASSGFMNGPTASTCQYCAGSSVPCGDYGCCTCYVTTCTAAITEIGCY